jgi:MFS transporter, ACS family, glucarate transporter
MQNLLRGRVRWVLIFWMFAISAIAYLDRVNISIAASFIQKDFNLDNVQLGYVFSAFVLGYALFQAPGGRLADRFGPRKVLMLGTVWWGVFTALTAAVPAGIAGLLAVLISVRFILGLGEAVVYPASNRLVAAWIPSQERGIANGFIFAGVGAGAGITPPLITFILLNYGWRWSFFISAAIGLVAGAIWFWIARDKPEDHPWMTNEEAEHIRTGLPAPKAKSSGGVPWDIIFSRNIVAVSAAYFAYGYSAYIFFTWFFLYLSKVRGLDLKASAWYGMLPFIAMATCSPIGGWISDRLTKAYGKRIGRCGVAVAGMAGAALFIALGTQVASPELASIVLAGGAGALYISQSSYWSVTADLAGPSAGTVSGTMNMIGQFGGTVTASLTPMIANAFGWSASFLVPAGLCACGALLWLLVDPEAEAARKPAASELAANQR